MPPSTSVNCFAGSLSHIFVLWPELPVWQRQCLNNERLWFPAWFEGFTDINVKISIECCSWIYSTSHCTAAHSWETSTVLKKNETGFYHSGSLQQVSRQHHHPTLDLFCCCSFRNFKHLNYKPNELWVQKPHVIESRTGVSAGPPTVSKSPSTNDVPANDVPKELYLHHYEGGGVALLIQAEQKCLHLIKSRSNMPSSSFPWCHLTYFPRDLSSINKSMEFTSF